MTILCDKGHEHYAWRAGNGIVYVEHVGSCWLITTRPRADR